MGCVFSKRLEQRDRTFLEKGITPSQIASGINVLRIRRQGEKSFFTLKRHDTNELDCIEKETEISDPEELEDVLKFLGCHLDVVINKKRRKTKFKGMEICLDEVEGLGFFIEVEKLTQENSDSLKIQEELFQFLESLGISREDRVINGYDTLIRNKYGESA